MTFVFTALRSTQITEVKITLGNPPECLFCIQASSAQHRAPFFFFLCTSQLLQIKSVSIKVRFSYTSLMIKLTSANFNIQLLTLKKDDRRFDEHQVNRQQLIPTAGTRC